MIERTNVKLQESENVLQDILSVNETALKESKTMHNESIYSMGELNKSLHVETGKIEKLDIRIEQANKDIIENQLEMLRTLEELSSSIEEESGTLIRVQREIGNMSNAESVKLLKSIDDMKVLLQTNQNILSSNLEATKHMASNFESNQHNKQEHKSEKKGFFSSFFDKN